MSAGGQQRAEDLNAGLERVLAAPHLPGHLGVGADPARRLLGGGEEVDVPATHIGGDRWHRCPGRKLGLGAWFAIGSPATEHHGRGGLHTAWPLAAGTRTVIGTPVPGSVEWIVTFLPSIAAMPSASIAHMENTRGIRQHDRCAYLTGLRQRLPQHGHRRCAAGPARLVPVDPAGDAHRHSRRRERVDPVDQQCRRPSHSQPGSVRLVMDHPVHHSYVRVLGQDLGESLTQDGLVGAARHRQNRQLQHDRLPNGFLATFAETVFLPVHWKVNPKLGGMRIGALATKAGLNTKTIRFYEQAGLVPEPARTPAGYRDYPPEATSRLAFIRDAQAAGLTLAEIRDVLAIRDGGQAPCQHVTSLIDQHLAQVEQRLAELAQARNALHDLQRRAASTNPADCAHDEICNILTTAHRP
jgi:MerR family copper efflux transcriptional regulator